MLVGTTNLNTTLNLTYVLTDVVETLLLDMRSEMKSGAMICVTMPSTISTRR